MTFAQWTSSGAVHKVRHAIFGQFWPPPPVTLCYTSREPPKIRQTSLTPRFLVGLVQKSQTKVPCTNSISIVREDFCPAGFVRCDFCPFPLLSQCICYNRKLNITLNFMFLMYDKNVYRRDVTCSWPPSPCHKLAHLLGPPPLERDVLYDWPLNYLIKIMPVTPISQLMPSI